MSVMWCSGCDRGVDTDFKPVFEVREPVPGDVVVENATEEC